MPAPVALFVFNRPEFTARVCEAVARAHPPRVLVVGDGPRESHPDDERLVAETRRVIEQVDWQCEVVTNYSDANLGCGRRIAGGLEWVFDSAPEAIVLEDDTVPDPTFFPFCEELLRRYRDDERVHMISGSNVIGQRSPYSYHFSRCFHIWGWASWARAWRHYDYEMRRWPELRDTDWLSEHLGDETGAKLAGHWFDETYAGRIRQWDFQWAFSGWVNDALAAVPSVNLVSNIGYGIHATHERNPDHPFARVPTEPMVFPLEHPDDVEVLESADRLIWQSLLAQLPSSSSPRQRDRFRSLAAWPRQQVRRLAG